MDNWLIFQYYLLIVRLTDGVTQEDSHSVLRHVEAGRPLMFGRKAQIQAEK